MREFARLLDQVRGGEISSGRFAELTGLDLGTAHSILSACQIDWHGAEELISEMSNMNGGLKVDSKGDGLTLGVVNLDLGVVSSIELMPDQESSFLETLRDRAQLQSSVLRLMRAHAENGVPYDEVVEFIRDTVIQTARNWDGSQAEPRKVVP